MPTPTRPHLQIVPLLGQVYTNHRTPSGLIAINYKKKKKKKKVKELKEEESGMCIQQCVWLQGKERKE
jgi:hypothetical protein